MPTRPSRPRRSAAASLLLFLCGPICLSLNSGPATADAQPQKSVYRPVFANAFRAGAVYSSEYIDDARSRQPSAWERSTWYVLVTLGVVVLQSALLAGLLIQRVRRRRAEEQTRHSEEHYRSVVDTQSELICRFLPDSTLTFVNDAYCRFWNKTREELLGTKFIALIPPPDREGVMERIPAAVSSVIGIGAVFEQVLDSFQMMKVVLAYQHQ